MEQLEGFRRWASRVAPMVCKLLKAVYGLKQAPFEWNSLLHSFLTDYGLHQLKCDSACYALITPTLVVYVAVYVDDVLIFSNDPDWTRQFKVAFAAAFDIKDLGSPVRVLGMTVVHDREKQTLLLHQGPYVRDLLSRFHQLDCKITDFPSPVSPAIPGTAPASTEEHSQGRCCSSVTCHPWNSTCLH